MEKTRIIRNVFMVLTLLSVLLVISCKKEKVEFPFSVLEEGTLKINTTYQLNGVREFNVVLTTADTNTIIVCGGKYFSTVFGTVSTSPHRIVIDGEFVRFRSSDYDTHHKVERYNEIIKITWVK